MTDRKTALEALDVMRDDLLNSMKVAIDVAHNDPMVKLAVSRIMDNYGVIRSALQKLGGGE